MRDHFRTGDQVLQAAWDEEKQAITMVPGVHTEFAIELSAADGDSVTAVGPSLTMTESVQDCSAMSKVCLFGEGVVSISPDASGEEFHIVTIANLEIKEICAMRIKLVGTGKLVLRG
jgi:hypothetical protein